MCGVIGWIDRSLDRELARRMRACLTHRGPDDEGEWCDPSSTVWLGHRRLSVLDLSTEGHQPMASPSGRYVITYNGEVVNHKLLRAELQRLGYQFRGHSDTEVVVAAIEAWGIDEALGRFIGMFAFGLYDRTEDCLWLVRDRMGIKPIYYAQSGKSFAFASELRPLRLLPWVDTTLDHEALAAYFRYLYVPAPATIFSGVRKLLPGTCLRWDGQQLEERRYWNLSEVAHEGIHHPVETTFSETADELDKLLRDAIRLQMEADVPLGAFLSGGIDSSTVVALMQAQSDRPVHTFSIGFSERSHDESTFARTVASYLGTQHHEERLVASDVLKLIPEIATRYDEPFGDSSSVPTFLVSRFARQYVTVALSGDGGDEMFGGYPRYFWASRIAAWRARLTPIGAQYFGRALGKMPAGLIDYPGALFGGNRWAGSEGLSARVRRLGRYLATDPDSVYEEVIAAWPDVARLLGGTIPNELGPHPCHFPDLDWPERMMAVDQSNQLPDDFLTKVDRASMAMSLEVRVPLLDHRIVEWSWRIPRSFKLASRGDRGKLLLREVLSRYVPVHLTDRPKMGFGMPLGQWLRNELKPWADGLLNSDRMRKQEILNPVLVREVWQEHLAGQDRLAQLWTVLMFTQWLEQSWT
ncbi:MAG TPA: asparagine synthase (glutamine-hydrolyzing) [Nitrospiraceae bacterium]|nr:asparagine synthase (glutamine-hydrolyzing) [Nitrospiraceae bacterium]